MTTVVNIHVMSNWWDSTQRHHLYGHHHGQVELLHHFLLALTTLLRMRLLVLWLWPSLTMDIWRIIAFAGFDMELSILRLRYIGACRLTLYWLMLLCWLWPLERIQRLLNDKMPCSAAYGQHHHESSLQLILTLTSSYYHQLQSLPDLGRKIRLNNV